VWHNRTPQLWEFCNLIYLQYINAN
jgi:hypothetical protein